MENNISFTKLLFLKSASNTSRTFAEILNDRLLNAVNSICNNSAVSIVHNSNETVFSAKVINGHSNPFEIDDEEFSVTVIDDPNIL